MHGKFKYFTFNFDRTQHCMFEQQKLVFDQVKLASKWLDQGTHIHWFLMYKRPVPVKFTHLTVFHILYDS